MKKVESGGRAFEDFERLPPELKEHVASFLESPELSRLGSTSRIMHAIAKPKLIQIITSRTQERERLKNLRELSKKARKASQDSLADNLHTRNAKLDIIIDCNKTIEESTLRIKQISATIKKFNAPRRPPTRSD